MARVSKTTLPALQPGGVAPGVLCGWKLTLTPLHRWGDLWRGCRGAGVPGCCWLGGPHWGGIEAGIAALGLGGGRPCLVVNGSEGLHCILIGNGVSLDTLAIVGVLMQVPVDSCCHGLVLVKHQPKRASGLPHQTRLPEASYCKAASVLLA